MEEIIQKINKRINDLREELDLYMASVNRGMGARQGAINELQRLKEELLKPKEVVGDVDEQST